MAMTEEEIAKLQSENEATKKQLADLLAKSKTDANEAEKAEAKRNKEKPGKVELDPDVVKEIAELKAKVAAMEKKLGSGGVASAGMRINFFGDD